jgi:uncharacterized protein YraI
MRKIAFLALAAASLYTTASQAGRTSPDTYLNVRSGPSVDSEIIAVIPPGADISIDKCRDSWCHVGWRGVSGWVNSRFLRVNF